jgi:hypothetical protein
MLQIHHLGLNRVIKLVKFGTLSDLFALFALFTSQIFLSSFQIPLSLDPLKLRTSISFAGTPDL